MGVPRSWCATRPAILWSSRWSNHSALYRELPPLPILRPFVECFWSARPDVGTGDKLIVPDGCMDIVLHPGLEVARVVGFMTKSQRIPATEAYGVRFRPGTSRAFLGGSPANLLTDRTPSLAELWSPGRVKTLWTDPDPLRALQRALLEKDLPELPNARLSRAIELLGVGYTIEKTAAAVALSRQQLTRLFQAHVGAGPKRFARIQRLKNVQDGLRRASGRSRADLALEGGYCDEAHLLREARLLLGSVAALPNAGNS